MEADSFCGSLLYIAHEEDTMELRIDPEFESKIPPLSAEEFRQLEENILSDGIVINPIIVWNGVIVDGHNRFHILEKHPHIQYTTHEKQFDDRFEVMAWICKNQLGRRNLTPEQKKYLLGKMHESRKKAQGSNNQYIQTKSEKHQNDVFHSNDVAKQIAHEQKVGYATVQRAAVFAKGVDIADEVDPGIRQEILAGEIKPTEAAVAAVVRAAPEDRLALVEELRKSPSHKDKAPPKKRKPPTPDEPDIKLIQKIADDMLLDRGNGNPDTMIYEMNDALESMMFRWDFCQTNYTAFFEIEKCRTEIKKLIRTGYEFFTQYEGGLTQYEDTHTPVPHDGD